MKWFFLFLFAAFIMTLSLIGQTQTEMNVYSCDSFKSADRELNLVYQKILKDYKQDTAFIKNLKSAQSLWIKLRDADLKAIYTPGEFYGSVKPMCACTILTEFTKERTKFLKTWTDGIEEGDACRGTRKQRD
jgi:uncharacterized protein YecT (DUF1311 family)